MLSAGLATSAFAGDAIIAASELVKPIAPKITAVQAKAINVFIYHPIRRRAADQPERSN